MRDGRTSYFHRHTGDLLWEDHGREVTAAAIERAEDASSGRRVYEVGARLTRGLPTSSTRATPNLS